MGLFNACNLTRKEYNTAMDKKNAQYQKKYRIKKDEKGLKELRGAWAKPENHKKHRDKINQEEGR